MRPPSPRPRRPVAGFRMRVFSPKLAAGCQANVSWRVPCTSLVIDCWVERREAFFASTYVDGVLVCPLPGVPVQAGKGKAFFTRTTLHEFVAPFLDHDSFLAEAELRPLRQVPGYPGIALVGEKDKRLRADDNEAVSDHGDLRVGRFGYGRSADAACKGKCAQHQDESISFHVFLLKSTVAARCATACTRRIRALSSWYVTGTASPLPCTGDLRIFTQGHQASLSTHR